MSKLKPISEVLVNHEVSVQKLPRGQNLVSVSRPGQTTIQVKLPLTEKNQYWCTIKVDGTESTVQCPDSGLSLKVGVLKQAANLANNEKTTVRIPISAAGEVSNFGVYAVPGLQTHVFVGPFTLKNSEVNNDDYEVITLDEESTTAATSDAQPPVQKEAISTSIQEVKSEIPKLIPMQKRPEIPKINDKKIRQTAIMGQVPQKIMPASQEPSNDLDIIDTQSDDEDKLVISEENPEYINPPKNPHGKVVYNPEKDFKEFYQLSDENEAVSEIEIEGFGKLLVHQGSNVLTFAHPKYKNHEVFCRGLNEVQAWMKYYLKEEQENFELRLEDDITEEETVLNESGPEKVQDGSAKTSPRIKIKPMASLITEPSAESSSTEHSDEPSDRIPIPDGTPRERIVNGRKFVCHNIYHNGKKGVAVVFDRRQHADMRQLYHKLNQVSVSAIP